MIEEQANDPWSGWRSRIVAARKRREEDVADWQANTDKRKGQRNTDSTRTVKVNKDWPMTKAKIALLYSRTPGIRVSSEVPQAAAIVPGFAKDLNATLTKSHIGAAIGEELADVVNAAGLSAVVISCEKRMETKDMPQMDPIVAGMSGIENPMVPVTTIADIRYPVRRKTPASLLIPSDFTGSVYDEARWLGYEDVLPWAAAKVEFGLTDDQKDLVCGSKSSTILSLNTDQSTKNRDTDVVNFQELFYWRHHYHEDETDFTALHRLVFVEGLEEPVIDEPYKGQTRGPDGRILGVKRNPIQILTLTYVSDEPFPPSDSTISRAQIDELEDSREQMSLQRKHSIPVRWFNPNVVSPNTRALLEKGTYQGWVPVANGERGIGEIARASFPPEKFELDRVINQEITDQWTVGPNQAGGFASGERSAREAGIVERNFQSRIGQERAKVEEHLLAIAEVVGGLMALHGATQMPPELLGSLTYSIHVDSTVSLSADEQIERLMKGLNLTAQSGYVNPKPIIWKIWELLGEDPSQIVIDPMPKPPEPVKVSVSKAEDLINPLFIATLMHTKQAPTPEELAAAIKLLEAAQQAAAGLGISLVPIEPVDPNQPPSEGVDTPEIANAGWEAAPRIERRDADGGA